MRWARFDNGGTPTYGVVEGDTIIPPAPETQPDIDAVRAGQARAVPDRLQAHQYGDAQDDDPALYRFFRRFGQEFAGGGEGRCGQAGGW